MGYVTVMFLGEKYQVSQTINEFLNYELTLKKPMMLNILEALKADLDTSIAYLKNDSIILFGDIMVNHIHNMADKYRGIVRNNVELLVMKLLELGVYDVTSDEMLADVTTIADIDRIENDTFKILLEEGDKIVDITNAGIEQAYHYAASNITGSGVNVFTNSFATLMISSLVERNILLSQVREADKEYEEAVKNLNSRATDSFLAIYREVVSKEFCIPVSNKMLEFPNKIMSVFYLELISHRKFDFESVENYNMKKAEKMLKNINQAPNKIEFLKQVFLTCPFSDEVYKECLKQGLLDKDTFETAKYFGMGEEIAVEMSSYIKNNLKNIRRVKPIISLLSSYRGTYELSIWKETYENTLKTIKDTYRLFNTAISDKKVLDRFIKENIDKDMFKIVGKSVQDITTTINRKIKSLVTEEQYKIFVNLGILSHEAIRMPNSSATDLNKINEEIGSALTKCIMKYIEEANKRLDAYTQAKTLFDKNLKQKEQELNVLKSEKEKLGLFAFSKKKELNSIIASKEDEISDFKRMNEPKDLLLSFKKMYE